MRQPLTGALPLMAAASLALSILIGGCGNKAMVKANATPSQNNTRNTGFIASSFGCGLVGGRLCAGKLTGR